MGFKLNCSDERSSGEPEFMKIEVAKDFSRTPGPRFRRLGRFSGEAFRAEIERALSTAAPNEVVEVWLDGTAGYGSSFLEEAFAGIVRHRLYSPEDLRRRLKIKAKTPLYETYAREARSYFEDALRGQAINSAETPPEPST